jgi:hypothetical protein
MRPHNTEALMDINQIEEGKTFVRYLPERTAGESFPAVVTGISKDNGAILTIRLISRNVVLTVKPEECILILPSDIRYGLIKFPAHHHLFGDGVVEEEEFSEGILYVIIGNGEHRSGRQPITSVTFYDS